MQTQIEFLQYIILTMTSLDLSERSRAILALLLDLQLSISNGFVSPKYYDKRDDLDFDIVNFPVWDSDVPSSTSYLISLLTRFPRISSHVSDKEGRCVSYLI